MAEEEGALPVLNRGEIHESHLDDLAHVPSSLESTRLTGKTDSEQTEKQDRAAMTRQECANLSNGSVKWSKEETAPEPASGGLCLKIRIPLPCEWSLESSREGVSRKPISVSTKPSGHNSFSTFLFVPPAWPFIAGRVRRRSLWIGEELVSKNKSRTNP